MSATPDATLPLPGRQAAAGPVCLQDGGHATTAPCAAAPPGSATAPTASSRRHAAAAPGAGARAASTAPLACAGKGVAGPSAPGPPVALGGAPPAPQGGQASATAADAPAGSARAHATAPPWPSGASACGTPLARPAAAGTALPGSQGGHATAAADGAPGAHGCPGLGSPSGLGSRRRPAAASGPPAHCSSSVSASCRSSSSATRATHSGSFDRRRGRLEFARSTSQRLARRLASLRRSSRRYRPRPRVSAHDHCQLLRPAQLYWKSGPSSNRRARTHLPTPDERSASARTSPVWSFVVRSAMKSPTASGTLSKTIFLWQPTSR